ncbi:peptidase M23-like protein [Streptomyces sp. Ag109_O5-1]|uniref:M23 family metallopeptidase n=1 Tax=Streptomyces sp. Ag109_O5-1 TaxID=1938851 RepID=UPI000FA4242C|nr:M23 family metallopeptidase [Streptomyces sp. Ag109_O5-1]RPE41905.1 peptidase M23-like protein [Streptomyces sp. Ag109_O5-1]
MRDTTGESATPRQAGRPDPRPAGAAAQALYRFLTAEAADRERLAPRVVAAVGRARLDEIVDVTLARIGDVTGIRDSRDGLVIEGTTGRTLAFAVSQDGLRLDEFLIQPGAYRPPRLRIPPEVRGAFGWIVLALLLVLRIEACWEAPSRIVWCGRVLMVVAGYVVLEGRFTPARLPWWIRRPVEAGALVALASAWRLPGLPVSGGNAAEPVVGLVLVGVFGALLVRARRHRWGTVVSRPLVFPLRGGSWYIAQGGGRGLNHHFAFPEQRGALDILQVGPGGARARHRARRDRAGGKNTSYLVYGQPVHAPCDGTVVSAADHIDDQEPGLIRYQPRYGNHVWIDTGAEIVKLVHLRPGTVTVAKGDTVRAGQVLGEVGNSGNSTEPHLHIHAERDGVGLDLEFEGVSGPLCRGRTVRS